MNKDAKTCAEWILNHPSLCGEVVTDAAKRLLAKPRRPRKSLAPGRMKPSKEEYREQTAKLRAELMALTGCICEWCGWLSPAPHGHMHHTVGGSGKRRQKQNISNVAWLCPSCHRRMHSDRDTAKTLATKVIITRAARRA